MQSSVRVLDCALVFFVLSFAVPVYFDTPFVNRSGVVGQEAALICNPHGDPPIAISWQTASSTIHSKADRLDIPDKAAHPLPSPGRLPAPPYTARQTG
jgi:hypothetical protein